MFPQQIFNEIDADGNGYITPEEVSTGFNKMGVNITIDDAKAIVSAADTNKDGRISYDGKQFKWRQYLIINAS